MHRTGKEKEVVGNDEDDNNDGKDVSNANKNRK